MGVMVALFPIPGYVAKWLQSVQDQRLKKVFGCLGPSASVSTHDEPSVHRPMLEFRPSQRVSPSAQALFLLGS